MHLRETLFQRVDFSRNGETTTDIFTMKHFSLVITIITRLSFIQYSLLALISLTTQSQVQGSCQPSTETVSIYGDDFSTPRLSLGDYYIKISRCVKCENCSDIMSKSDYPVPANTTIIKVIVRDSATGVYHRYSVHNHTSCKCGNKDERYKKLYEKDVKVDKKTATKEIQNNPTKIPNKENPQQRYRFMGDGANPRYYGYKQCIPKCPSIKAKNEPLTVYYKDGRWKKISVTNDVKCDCGYLTSGKHNKRKDFSLNMDSKKTFFIAIVLTVVLVIILLLDFVFCRQKKGFCYSLMTNCSLHERQRCPHCHSEEIVV